MNDTVQALRVKYSAIIRERDKNSDQPVSVLCNKHGISLATFLPVEKDSLLLLVINCMPGIATGKFYSDSRFAALTARVYEYPLL